MNPTKGVKTFSEVGACERYFFKSLFAAKDR
jgi:hypothetical protein